MYTMKPFFRRALTMIVAAPLWAQLPAGVTSTDGGADFVNFTTPIGLAASPSRLLATNGGCQQVCSISSGGGVSLYATLPVHPLGPQPDCEMMMVTSPGLPGFPRDTVYLAQANLIYQLPPFSSTPSLFATLPVSVLGGTLVDVHADLTIDDTGAFNNVGPSMGTPKMIVTISQGPTTATPLATTIFLVDGAGNFSTLVAGFSTRLEGPAVVPLSNGGSLAGKVLIGGESSGLMYSVDTTGTVTPITNVLPSPESVEIVPPQLCTFGGFPFFTIEYFSDFSKIPPQFIEGVPLSSFSHVPAGSALVPTELVENSIGLITWSGGTPTFTPRGFDFTTPFVQFAHEGSTFVTCTAPGSACPATKGYWKHHAFSKSLFPTSTSTVNIGGVTYSASDLVDILTSNAAGGNAVTIMGSQLVAAILNIGAGAQHSAQVDAAIASAQNLLQFGLPGNNPPGVTFPINMTTGYVAASTALGTAMTDIGTFLDGYNSANFNTCSEGSGLQ
jgi:hypothetical protein